MASQSTVDPRGPESAAVWDEAEARHVRSALFAAPLHDDPSTYLVAENVFSPAAYAAILRSFPDDAAFERWNVPADGFPRIANYDRRRQIDFPEHADRLPPAQREFWSALTSFLCAPAFARMLLERFSAFLRGSLGAQLDDPSFAQERTMGTMTLFQHGPGYFLGPHTDRREKVFTVLLYFAEREGLDHLGTTIYRPLERGFTCEDAAHYDPAGFERLSTVPYRPNSAFVFPRTNDLFHGVEALTENDLQGSRRRGIQVSIWLRNDRPRSACKTSIEADVPATMRARGTTPLSYRLTNRADCELASSFPKTIKVGYRWVDAGGVTTDADAVPLPSAVAAGDSASAQLRVVAPGVPGRYLLRVSPLQDGVAWFDDIDPRNGRAELVQVWDDARASAASDIVAESDALALGAGWEPVEREGERAFRWASDDAVVHVAALKPVHRMLCLLVEPGPGVGSDALALTARLADGADLGTVTVSSRTLVRYALPPQVPAVYTIVLHAENGGRISGDDPRGLNVRALDVFVESFADVFPAWAQPGHGFYPAERCDGDVYRWVCGDATVDLASARGRTLRFGVEAGPGIGSSPFVLRVVGGTRELLRAEIRARTTVDVPLGDDLTAIELKADGGGRLAPGDPRTLDFRVFAVNG